MLFFILIIVPYKLIFSLEFNKRDDSWSKKSGTKKRTKFVICHLVSSSSGLHPSLFRPSPIFRRPLFMCFSATASRQRRELPMRRWASLHPFLSLLSFDPFVANFQESKGGIRARESSVKYFESVNRWKPIHSRSGHGSAIFFPFFRESKVPWS